MQLADAGAYNVTLTNPYGTTNSTSGTVTVFAVTNYPFAALYGNPLAYYRLNESGGSTAAMATPIVSMISRRSSPARSMP